MKHAFRVTIVLAALLIGPAAFAQHQVVLSWTASTDAAANPTLTYNVYRSNTTCALATTFAKINASPITAVTYTDTSVGPGSFCYEATAVLNGVESTNSNTAQAVILPSSPTSLTVTSSK
jgi:hypothetical protein